jgi:hypothetical protein
MDTQVQQLQRDKNLLELLESAAEVLKKGALT